MAITDRKIQSSEVSRLHVQGADDILSGSPADNKAIFDALPELIVQRHNLAIDDIVSIVNGLNARIDDAGANKVRVKTTAEWNSQADLVSEQGIVYVYTDYYTNEQDEPIPAFKIGDGLAYLIDLPLNEDINIKHQNNTHVHVTDEERDSWNDKVTVYIAAFDDEELVFSKE